jgi:alginate O-acetyltransferase complex protein AlgI
MNAAATTTMLGDIPRWAVMWALAAALFFAGKAAILRRVDLRGWRLAGFAFGWVGMDAAPFRAPRATPPRPGAPEVKWPLACAVLGAVLLWSVARRFTHPLAAGWAGMVGLILLLHFGTFGLLAAAWHANGVPVAPIMRFPAGAASLSEFWGRRWNVAFRDLAHRIVFSPVSHRSGHKVAMWASFMASGLAHELVISVPAGAGFGLPMSYFLLQALGVTLERRADTLVRNELKTADRSVRAPFLWRWLRTHAFTLLPAFILFHPPFVERVMIPFFRVIGALP